MTFSFFGQYGHLSSMGYLADGCYAKFIGTTHEMSDFVLFCGRCCYRSFITRVRRASANMRLAAFPLRLTKWDAYASVFVTLAHSGWFPLCFRTTIMICANWTLIRRLVVCIMIYRHTASQKISVADQRADAFAECVDGFHLNACANVQNSHIFLSPPNR